MTIYNPFSVNTLTPKKNPVELWALSIFYCTVLYVVYALRCNKKH